MKPSLPIGIDYKAKKPVQLHRLKNSDWYKC